MNAAEEVAYDLMSEADRRARNPGRAPLYYERDEARAWLDGYRYAQNEASQAAARKLREAGRSV